MTRVAARIGDADFLETPGPAHKIPAPADTDTNPKCIELYSITPPNSAPIEIVGKCCREVDPRLADQAGEDSCTIALAIKSEKSKVDLADEDGA
jgi:hypothetical protein